MKPPRTYKENQTIISKIILPYGMQSKLAALFGVSRMTIFNAIHFKSNSQLAQDIRNTAIIDKYEGALIRYTK